MRTGLRSLAVLTGSILILSAQLTGLAKESGKTTLTFWSWVPTIDQSRAMIAEFERQNPDIHVEYVRTEMEDFYEHLQVALASGKGPDLFGLTTGAMIEQYEPYAEDIDLLCREYWKDWKTVIRETAVDSCIGSDGMIVGMPILITGMTDMLYNQTLMEECGIDSVPKNYGELKAAAKKAEEHGYTGLAVGAADGWVNADWFVQISNEFEEGAVYEAEAGLRSWTDPCFVDTMKAWGKLFEDGILEEGALGIATYPDASEQYFKSRKAIFFLTGSWHLGCTSPSSKELEGTAIGENKDEIGMCMFPSMTDDGRICGTSGVDFIISVNKDCKDKEAAMRFVTFMADGYGQQYLVDELQGAPVSERISYQGIIDGTL